MMPRTKLVPLLLLPTLLAAWLIIITNLSAESMWYDEWFTWQFSTSTPLELVSRTAQDVHPPLYYLWVWLWTTFAGSDDLFVMRMSSAAAALLSLALIYKLGKTLFRNEWAGFAALCVLATSGIFIYYARELRMYSFVLMLVILSWIMLIRAMKGSRWGWIAYAASVALLAYTYYFAVFSVIGQIIFIVVCSRASSDKVVPSLLPSPRLRGRGVGGEGHLWSMAKALALALLLFLPWLPVLYNQLVLERLHSGNAEGPLIGKFAATLPTNAESILSFINMYTASQPGLILLLVAFSLVVFIEQRSRLQPDVRTSYVGMLVWTLSIPVLFFGINLVIPIYHPRYALYMLVGLALIIGFGIALFPFRRTRAGLVFVLALSVLLTHTSAFLPAKTPHQELLGTIADNVQPGDRIWYNFSYGALGSSIQFDVDYYLSRQYPQLDPDRFIWDAPVDLADSVSNPRVWDVRPYWIDMPDAAAAALLQSREMIFAETFGEYAVRLYQAQPQQALFRLEDAATGTQFSVASTGYRVYPSEGRIILDTWWRSDNQPTLDYSYTLLVTNTGQSLDTVLLQTDGAILNDENPTSLWSAGGRFRHVPLEITLPPDLLGEEYDIYMGAYYYQRPSERMEIHLLDDSEDITVTDNLIRIALIR
jgi:uncharacterized membrane protein